MSLLLDRAKLRCGSAVLMLLAGLATAGCFRTGKNGRFPSPRGCSSDNDCSAARNEVCRLPNGLAMHTPGTNTDPSAPKGICVVPASRSERQVFLEIRPAGNMATLPVQWGPVKLDKQALPIAVPLPVTATGRVVQDGSQTPIGGASVHLVLSSLIPNRPQYFDVTSSTDQQTLGTFSHTLPQGAYTVEVSPIQVSGQPPPPLERFQTTLRADGTFDTAFTVTNPLVVSGRLVSLAADAPHPISNVGVQAVQPAADSNTTPAAISEVASTSADGSFQLALSRRLVPSAGGSWKVSLQVSPLSATTTFPTFLELPSIDVLAQGNYNALLELPGNPVTIRGTVLAPDGSPVSGALVSFRTTDDAKTASGKFTYSTVTTSAADGSFKVDVVPADYIVLAQPPPDTDPTKPGMLGFCGLTPGGSGTLVHAGDVDVMSYIVPLGCESRQFVGVAVEDADGNPVSDVVVIASRQPTAGFPGPLQFQATTNDDGECLLPLYSGVYDVSLQPPAGTKLPYSWFPGAIEAGDDTSNASRTLVLGEPFELFGNLTVASTGAPLQAIIEAYAADTTSTVLIGRGQSASDGTYSIVLPAASPVTATPVTPSGM